MKKVWPIKNLDCAACAAKLEDALSRVPGVENVSVNYLNATITLIADDEHFEQVTAAMLAKAAKVEPDAEIVTDAMSHDSPHHEHAYEHHHDHEHAHHDHEHKKCCCGHAHEHNHHDEHDHDHGGCCYGHEHEHDHHDEHDHGHGGCCCGHDHDHEEAPADTTSPLAVGNVRKIYPIEGLDCGACAAKLEDALSKLDGIVSVRVSFVNKNVVLVAPESKLTAITKAMADTCKKVEPDAVIRFDASPAPARKTDEKKRGVPVLLIRVACAVALMVIAMLLPESLGLVKTLLFIAAYLSASYDVLWKAIKNISRGQVFDENFLMTVASIGALIMGEFPEAVAVMSLYQIGEWFQDRAVDKSRESIASLMDIRPDYANLLVNGETRVVAPETVRVGDMIVVRPGEKVPLDGEVVDGVSSLNTVALTGESLPRDVAAGDTVISGCVNLSGLITVRVTSEFGESTVAKILNLVETSGDNKAQTEKFITKFARYYTPAVCAAALLLAVVPSLVTGDWNKWIYQALSFLVISCPCALVISVPLSFFSGIGGASRKGILIKGANYMEVLSQLDTVAFDKTGTLTKGVFSVSAIHPENGSEEELLDMAAHAESYSTHPISKSLQAAYAKPIDQTRVTGVEEIAGHGVKATVDGKQIHAGNDKLMVSLGLSVKPCEVQGTIVHTAADGEYRGHIVISDMLKPTTAQAMTELKAAGVSRLVMLTGDRKAVAEDIASRIGMTEVKAELLPSDKVNALESLLGEGHKVGFVGDGINDAPVLRRADLGIAMGAMGSDAAIEAADVVLMDDDPIKLPLAMRIARRTMTIVRQNIIFALAVKALIMLLGFLGIANMWLAIFADVGVAMLAILNAMRAMRCK